MSVSPDEHVLVLEPSWEQRALELLLPQHRGKPNIEGLVRSLAAGAQIAELTTFAVIVGGSTIDAAEGATLDRWGELVGEVRGGLDHEEYLRFIRLRIRVNTEHPSEDAVYSVLADAVGDGTVTSYLVADGIVFVVSSPTWLPLAVATHAGALIRDFRPAGLYVAVCELLTEHFPLIGTVLDPGTLVLDIGDTVDNPIGRLIYGGR